MTMHSVVFSQIPIDELDLLIEQGSERAVRKVLYEIGVNNPAPIPEFLTKTQAREYLGGLSQPTFDKLVEKQVFTAYKVSEGRIVFFLPELRQYVLNQKNPSK